MKTEFIQPDTQDPRNMEADIPRRHRKGNLWHKIFITATTIGIIALTALLLNVLDGNMGYMAFEYKVAPASLTPKGVALEGLSKDQLIMILQENISTGAFKKLENQKPFSDRTIDDIINLIIERVAKPDVLENWGLFTSLFQQKMIEARYQELLLEHPQATLKFKTWLSLGFLLKPQNSDALFAGVRTAILGSLWTIFITIIVALPIGVGAAIYLEEYAADNTINRMIRTNINNLAGVPSIIYGILGLAIFVRVLEPLTSGAIFGYADPTTANGRTILAAGLTLALLVLPVVIINGQEAIRSVPSSLRQASYGLGATKLQTIWHHVLPNAMPGILTGTILAVSRALGETAPLVVVGAATYIDYDPNNLFSKFTTLPIQIYQWVSRAQGEFRAIAAAAILVLLSLLLTLNAIAIILRNKYSRRTLQ